jgi:hypothetical protein
VTAPVVRWLGNSDIIRHIYDLDPNAPKPAYSLGPPDREPPSTCPTVARYRSFAQFQADTTRTPHTFPTIDPGYEWVLYDPENWADTPVEEQQDPWTWLPRFGQFAHARGYRVIAAPARDLGNVAGTAWPKNPGETLDLWYLRTALSGVAAQYSDIVSIQSQADTEDVAAYKYLVSRAAQYARNGNPYVKVFAGISTNYGTPTQMAAAAKSVHVDGYWLNVPGPEPDIGKAVEWLRFMTGSSP